MGLASVSFYGIMPYIGGAKNGLSVMIVYQNLHRREMSIPVKLDLVAEGYSTFLSKQGIVEIDSHETIYLGTSE